MHVCWRRLGTRQKKVDTPFRYCVMSQAEVNESCTSQLHVSGGMLRPLGRTNIACVFPMFICSPRVVSQLSRLVTALVRRQAISGMLKPLKYNSMSSSNIRTLKHQHMMACASLVHKVCREEGHGHCLVEPGLETRPLLLRICSTVAGSVLMRAWVRGYVEPHDMQAD